MIHLFITNTLGFQESESFDDTNRFVKRPGAERSLACWKLAAAVLLPLLLIASLALNLYGNQFPTSYHADELKKLNFISSGTQDFMHPLLLLQLVRVPNQWFAYGTSLALATLGRSMVGMVGTVSVALAYFLVRCRYSEQISFAVAASVAVCPTVVIHSHYIKEDILLTTSLMASLLSMSIFVQTPTLLRGCWVGIACGFAFSSHYKSILLVPLLFAFLFHEYLSIGNQSSRQLNPLNCKRIAGYIGIASIVSGLVFLTINLPAAANWAVFFNGIAYEVNHVREGHSGIRIYPIPEWFTFHLRNNLLPGMTPAMCLWGVAGLTTILIRWKNVPSLMRLIAMFTILFYLVPELSPTKPPPDDGRYVVPVAVGLLCCVAELLRWSACCRAFVRRFVSLGFGLSLVWTVFDSALLVWNMERDTRATAKHWIAENLPSDATILFCRHAHETEGDVGRYQTGHSLLSPGTDFLVVSSFQYDRFLQVASLPGHDSEVYEQAKEFRDLFQLPYKEFRPRHRTLAFSNPVIRVVQLGKKFQLPDD